MPNPPKRKPVGESIRDLINPALEDTRRLSLQARMLDEIFAIIAQKLPRVLMENYRDLSQAVAQQRPEDRNPLIIEALTAAKGGFPAVLPIEIPLSTEFTLFSKEEIKEMPGYIKLHETARAENIAFAGMVGILSDGPKGMSGLLPKLILIDCSKSYEDGALEHGDLYPNLPEPAVEPGQKPESFDI